MKPNRTLPVTSITLRKFKLCVITANTPSHTGKRLAGLVIARPTTKSICVSYFDQGRIGKRRAEWRLIVVRRLSGDRKADTEISSEDDGSWTFLGDVFTFAAAEEKREAACFVLRRGRDVEASQCAFIVWGDDGGLASGIGLVGSLLGNGE